MFYWFSFIILLFSLSIDTFIAGVSIGLSKIKIPITSILIICFINTFMLACAYILGERLCFLLSNHLIIILSSLPFLLLGSYKILEARPNLLVSKKQEKISFIKYIIHIFQYPESAYKVDLDFSKTLSMKELILLSISLSLDNLIAGLGLGVKVDSFFFLFILNYIISFLFLMIGNRLFFKFTNHSINWSFVSGIIFMIVGIYRIFS